MNGGGILETENRLELVGLQKTCALEELHSCNEMTAPFGLSLSDTQMTALVENRFEALQNTGRVEFGEGILKKLIYAFCDSPFLTQENYEETISDLQDIFYYFKNESLERVSDDELIGYIKKVFDGRAQGSVEYLEGTSLEELCRSAREGYDPFVRNEDENRNEVEDEDEDEAGDLF